MLTSLPKKAHTQYSIVNVNWFLDVHQCLFNGHALHVSDPRAPGARGRDQA